MHFWI